MTGVLLTVYLGNGAVARLEHQQVRILRVLAGASR